MMQKWFAVSPVLPFDCCIVINQTRNVAINISYHTEKLIFVLETKISDTYNSVGITVFFTRVKYTYYCTSKTYKFIEFVATKRNTTEYLVDPIFTQLFSKDSQFHNKSLFPTYKRTYVNYIHDRSGIPSKTRLLKNDKKATAPLQKVQAAPRISLTFERDTKATAIASPGSFLIKLRERSEGSFQRRTREAPKAIDEHPVPSGDPKVAEPNFHFTRYVATLQRHKMGFHASP